MPSSDPTFPVCLPPSSLEPPVHPSGPLPGSSYPAVLPGPAPWPLAHSLPGQLPSSPPPVRTQTKVDPSPTLPRSSRDSGTETRRFVVGHAWVFKLCFFPRSHCACRAMTARRRRSPSRRPATQSRLAPPAPLVCFPMCYLRKASAGGGSAAENPIQDVMTTKRPKKKVIRS